MNHLIPSICLLFSAFLFFDVSAQNDCFITPQSAQLDINNASVTYSTSGNQWNNSEPGYLIPKDDGIGSVYAGHPFLGGFGDDENLYVSTGNLYGGDQTSFRPGPMNVDTEGNFVTLNCQVYNTIYKVSRGEIILHRLYFQMMEENGGDPPTDPPFENGYDIPEDILNWPAHTEVIPGEPQALAPFFEDDCCGGTPGVYEPELGDYPAFEFEDNSEEFDCEKHLLGDQVLWWVMNDASGSTNLNNPLGVEIHNMAYAYLTEGHLNNATFLRRSIINRSNNNYSEVYYGERVDGDLGNAQDDYFGTDVERGMAYYYNSDNNDDEFAPGYGISPPAIGFTWVGGPLAEESDGLDNDYDGETDEADECLRMDFANLQTGINSPFSPDHFYNMLSGSFQNGDPFMFEDQNNNEIPFKMIYPGDSDPFLLNTFGVPVDPWTELTAGNFGDDRKHWMSSGPFSFEPNDEVIYTLAISWARDMDCDGIPCSVDLLREAIDEVQGIHNECYEIPCIAIEASFNVSIENGLASFSSPITSGLQYTWTFGDGSELTTETPFASHTYDNADDFEACLEIDFGCGTSSSCQSIGGFLADMMLGPELTQIEGMGNTHNYMALTEETISSIFENDSSMVLHPTYKSGMGPVKVHVYDLDNIVEGDYVLQFDSTGANSNWKMYIVGTTDTVYSEVPIGVPNAQFIENWGMMVSTDAHLSEQESVPVGARLHFNNDNTPWLTHVSDTDDLTYFNWIREGNVSPDCQPESQSNCYYLDEEQTQLDPCFFSDREHSTPDESFEKLISGGWSPSHFVPFYDCHPRFNGGMNYSGAPLSDPGRVRNVDLVMTSDKTLWTRCPVIDLNYSEDADSRVRLRDTLSVDKNGLNQNHPDCNIAEATLDGQQVDGDGISHGMGWFPGYAIDVNSGKRLNIVFGENPKLESDNGNDMIWNPTSTVSEGGEYVNFGGMHSITVMSDHEQYPDLAPYDFGSALATFISAPSPFQYRSFQSQQQWTGMPILSEGFELLPIEEGLIPTETTIQLRLRHRYQNYLPGEANINNGNPLYNFTIDYEDLISGVEELEQYQVQLYPNPTSNQLNIQLSGFESQVVQGRISNMSGQLVREVQLIGSGYNVLDVSELKNGMYILHLNDESHSAPQFKRFMITR